MTSAESYSLWLKQRTVKDKMKKSVAKINNISHYQWLHVNSAKVKNSLKKICFVQIFITDILYFLCKTMQLMLK